MQTVRYIKSFSKGQITIPKEYREFFGVGDDFWLKMQINNGRIIAEPVDVDRKKDKERYKKTLLSIKGDWFSYKDYKRNRAQVEKRLKRLWNE